MIYLAFLIILILLGIYIIHYIDGYRWVYIDCNSLKKLDKEYCKKPLLKDCIITLTTTPNRIGKIRTTLISLLDNSHRVEEIRLNIPYYSHKGIEYVIPQWLQNLKSIKIHRIIKDWGPASKLIPTLLRYKQEKNKKIIVVDDDVIYGYYTFKTLYDYFLRYNQSGKKTAITMYGDTIKKNGETNDKSVSRYCEYFYGNKLVDLIRGHASYMVTPDMFTDNIFSYQNLPKEAFFVDDNTFSSHLIKNNVNILMIGLAYKSVPLPDMVACHYDALHKNYNANGKNEKIINKILRA